MKFSLSFTLDGFTWIAQENLTITSRMLTTLYIRNVDEMFLRFTLPGDQQILAWAIDKLNEQPLLIHQQEYQCYCLRYVGDTPKQIFQGQIFVIFVLVFLNVKIYSFCLLICENNNHH